MRGETVQNDFQRQALCFSLGGVNPYGINACLAAPPESLSRPPPRGSVEPTIKALRQTPGEEDPIPSFRQLRYFTHIVELGSISRAAEQLNISQTALGSQIRQLEEELGVALLSRHSRGASATAAGRLLHVRANEILIMLQSTVREVGAFREDLAESVVLGVSQSVVHLAAPEILTQAAALMPGVSLRLTQEYSLALADAMKRGELDVLLAHDIPPMAGIERTALLREELIFVTAADEGRPKPVVSADEITETITLAEALKHDLTLPARVDGLRAIVDAAAQSLNLTYRPVFPVQSPQALKMLIADRSIASIVPYGIAVAELRAGRFAARRIVGPSLRRTLHLVRTSKRLSDVHERAFEQLMAFTHERLLRLLGPLATSLKNKKSG